MLSVQSVAEGFSPLDEELALSPGTVLTPWLEESLARLGSWMAFEHAAQMLAWFTGVVICTSTARQKTEAAGEALVRAEEAFVKDLILKTPPGPVGPELQLLSVDGAFVPLVGGEWKEVKTLTLGEVQPAKLEKGLPVVHTTNLSYFSRCTDAQSFASASLGEIHRRGVESAGAVCAVSDGAPWIQGFVDEHCADAVRILDFWHATEHLANAGKARYMAQAGKFEEWFTVQCQALKAGKIAQVLVDLELLKQESSCAEAKEIISQEIAYLSSRKSMLTYDQFTLLGYPIGSGSAESANKVVMQGRLKGAGMRWAIAHVNPMLALRTVVCNDRWDNQWPQVRLNQIQVRAARIQARREERNPKVCVLTSSAPELEPAPPMLAVESAPATVTKLLPPRPPYSWRVPFLRRLPSKN